MFCYYPEYMFTYWDADREDHQNRHVRDAAVVAPDTSCTGRQSGYPSASSRTPDAAPYAAASASAFRHAVLQSAGDAVPAAHPGNHQDRQGHPDLFQNLCPYLDHPIRPRTPCSGQALLTSACRPASTGRPCGWSSLQGSVSENLYAVHYRCSVLLLLSLSARQPMSSQFFSYSS